MKHEPIICRKCAHMQFSGTHCDFCGTPLKEPPPKEKMSKFARLRILSFVAIFVLFFLIYFLFHLHHT